MIVDRRGGGNDPDAEDFMPPPYDCLEFAGFSNARRCNYSLSLWAQGARSSRDGSPRFNDFTPPSDGRLGLAGLSDARPCATINEPIDVFSDNEIATYRTPFSRKWCGVLYIFATPDLPRIIVLQFLWHTPRGDSRCPSFSRSSKRSPHV